jgi:YegS/Rv2252/BmrU family lipid kinase
MQAPVALLRAAIVVNPTKVADLQGMMQRAGAALHEAGWAEPLWYETTASDSGFGQAKAAIEQGVAVVVACGGDGTVRECVRALCGTEVALGILPAGTGNLFAHAMAIPVNVAGAIEIVTRGQRRRIDVGDAAGKTFLVMAGMGFDAEMVGDASEDLKARIGVGAYVLSALQRLLKKPMRVRVTLDQQPSLERYARCVLVGKVGRLPGGIQLMDVKADDGILAVVIITANTIGHWIKIAWAIVTRRSRVPRVETYHAKSVHIEATYTQRRQVDGDEIAPGRTMDFKVAPRAVLVCVPNNDAAGTG